MNAESEDTPVYSNDFWESHYVPFEREVGTFDFGIMYKMFIDRMPVLPEDCLNENPVREEAQEDEEVHAEEEPGEPDPNIHDDSTIMDNDCAGNVMEE